MKIIVHRRKYKNFNISKIFPSGKRSMTEYEADDIEKYIDDEIKDPNSDIRRDIRNKYKTARPGHYEESILILPERIGVIIEFNLE